MAPYADISANLSGGNLNNILEKLTEVKVLLPFLVNLTAEERQTGLKLGDKSEAFVKKALEYATAHPEIVPPFLDVGEFNKDHTLREKLKAVLRELKGLTEAVDDTIFALGKESFEQALTFYDSAKQADKRNVPGVGSIVSDLAARFPGNQGSSDSDPGNGGTPPDGSSPPADNGGSQ